MNNNGLSFKDFDEIKKIYAQNRLGKPKSGFQIMYGCSLVLNDLK